MLIFFENEGFSDIYNDGIKSIFNEALKLLKQPDNLQVEVGYISEDDIQELNLSTRRIDRVTDVLSFPMLEIHAGEVADKKKYPLEVDFETGNLMLGSIVICQSVAKRQSVEYGHSMEREMAYLALHGLLHLLGYDHIEDADKPLMREKEELILSKFNITR